MYTKDLNYTVTIRISEKNYKKLNILARNRGCNISMLLRYIIEDYLLRFRL